MAYENLPDEEMKTRLLYLLDLLRSSFWFVPLVLCALALTLAMILPVVDNRFGDDLKERFTWLTIAPETAQAILSTISGAMFTVAGVVFSITFVTLSIASSQLGPRLLRTFMSNRSTHFAFGVFIGSGIYALAVLAIARGTDDYRFVPSVSVMTAVVLCIFSMLYLISFIHNVANLVQAPNVVRAVAYDLNNAIERLYPSMIGAGGDPALSEEEYLAKVKTLGSDSFTITSAREGYIQAIDLHRLMQLAHKRDWTIRSCHRPGHFITRGQPLVEIWGTEAKAEDKKEVSRAYITGNRQTPWQDVESAVAELAEVAVRALSPSLNDPFTAIHSIDHLGAALSRLAQREAPSPFRYDDEGNLRLLLRGPSFPNVLEAAFNPIREYSQAAVPVLIRLLEKLAIIAGALRRDEDRAAVRRQAAMIFRLAERTIQEPNDLADVRDRFEALGRALSPETDLENLVRQEAAAGS